MRWCGKKVVNFEHVDICNGIFENLSFEGPFGYPNQIFIYIELTGVGLRESKITYIRHTL